MIKTIVDAHDYNFNFQKNCELNRIARETCEKKELNLKSKDLLKVLSTTL